MTRTQITIQRITVTCDRCAVTDTHDRTPEDAGRLHPPTADWVALEAVAPTFTGDAWHLCGDCYAAFKKWMDRKP